MSHDTCHMQAKMGPFIFLFLFCFLLLLSVVLLDGVQGEGKVGAKLEGDKEVLTLGGQLPAKVHAFNDQS